MHFFDSSAWMAYFFGDPWAKAVAPIIDSTEPILLSVINLAEVHHQFLLRSPLDAEEKRRFMMVRCSISDVNAEIALEASRIKAIHGLSMADALLLATGRVHECLLQTFDSDFQGLKGARVLKRR